MRQLYTGQLGWQLVADNVDIVFYTLNGLLPSLCSRAQLADFAGLPAPGSQSGFRGFTLAHNVCSDEQVRAPDGKRRERFIHVGHVQAEARRPGLLSYSIEAKALYRLSKNSRVRGTIQSNLFNIPRWDVKGRTARPTLGIAAKSPITLPPHCLNITLAWSARSQLQLAVDGPYRPNPYGRANGNTPARPAPGPSPAHALERPVLDPALASGPGLRASH